jgi:3-oxoacyl-[acyl-carrier-protein] synthase II
MERRVVVTGMGAVTPLGQSVAETWENIKKGKSGVSYITLFDTENFPVKIAAEVKNFTPSFVDEKEARKYDRFELFALKATEEALKSAGLIESGNIKIPDPQNTGVIIGSGIGGIKTIEDSVRTLVEKGPRRVSPLSIPVSIINMASGLISIKLGVMGPSSSPATACAAGLQAIGEAYHLIKHGICDMVIAGGAEAPITPLGISAFASMRALSTRNDEPEKASRPFDKNRDGFVMGEGAGILILEEYEHAKKRGAEIYAEIKGFGMSLDAYHITAPHPEGLGFALAMERALKDAKIEPEKIEYINAHGTSTKYNDEIETKAIKNVFGEHAKKLMVSSTKSMTGHMIAAGGAVEVIFCILAICEGIIPPTINLDEPDPECDLDYVPHYAREKKISFAMSNSFGFGGINTSIVISKI